MQNLAFFSDESTQREHIKVIELLQINKVAAKIRISAFSLFMSQARSLTLRTK